MITRRCNTLISSIWMRMIQIVYKMLSLKTCKQHFSLQSADSSMRWLMSRRRDSSHTSMCRHCNKTLTGTNIIRMNFKWTPYLTCEDVSRKTLVQIISLSNFLSHGTDSWFSVQKPSTKMEKNWISGVRREWCDRAVWLFELNVASQPHIARLIKK